MMGERWWQLVKRASRHPSEASLFMMDEEPRQLAKRAHETSSRGSLPSPERSELIHHQRGALTACEASTFRASAWAPSHHPRSQLPCHRHVFTHIDSHIRHARFARRYQLWDMKKMCESMIKVDVGNCVSVLDVAVVVGAERLKSEALSVLSRKLGGVGELEGWREMMDELGGRVGGEVMGELVGLLVEKERQKLRVGGGVSDVEKGVVDAGLAAGREVSLSVEVRGEVRKRWLLKKEMEKESVEELIEGQGLGVNMIVGLGLVVLMGVYLKLSKVIVLGPIVPVVNIVFLLGFMGRAAYSLRGDVGKRGKGKKRRSLR